MFNGNADARWPGAGNVCVLVLIYFGESRAESSRKKGQPRLQTTLHVDTGSTQSDVIRSKNNEKKRACPTTLTPFMRVAMCDTTTTTTKTCFSNLEL